MLTLYGTPVSVSDLLLRYRQVPNRSHKQRRNQSLAYHRRVQKKWNKRFGEASVHDPQVIRIQDPFTQNVRLVMDPETFRQFSNQNHDGRLTPRQVTA